MLRYSESQLCIEVDVVIPGEDVSICQLCEWQTHHFRETGPGTAIKVGDALGSDDRYIARTLNDHRTRVQPSITDALAGIGSQSEVALHYDVNLHSYSCRRSPNIA